MSQPCDDAGGQVPSRHSLSLSELASVSPVPLTWHVRPREVKGPQGSVGTEQQPGPPLRALQTPPAKLPTGDHSAQRQNSEKHGSVLPALGRTVPLAASGSARVHQVPAQGTRSQLGPQHPQRWRWRHPVCRAWGLEGLPGRSCCGRNQLSLGNTATFRRPSLGTRQ